MINDPSGDGEALLRLLSEGSDTARQAGRPDLARSLDTAAARIRRPSTVICVVGEYKQGKSHVINAVVGREICVVDDDLATAAITVIGHGEKPVAVVHRTEHGERLTEQIELSDVARFTVESAEGQMPDGIDLVEVAVPSPSLAQGMAIVDTPGVNALAPGNDRAIVDFLAYADALLLVTDASAELSPSEVRFLAAARERCPTVLVALSKIDLYPEWRRIAELDAAHLAELQLFDALVPVSSVLQSSALEIGDDRLDDESGYRQLRRVLEQDVLAAARRQGRQRARNDFDHVVAVLIAEERARLAALENPERGAQQLAELRRGREGVARLRAASAKWMVVLNDGFTDVRSEVDYRLRTEMRRHLQTTDRSLANGDPKSDWDTVVTELKTSLAELAEEQFAAVRLGTDRIATLIGELIAEEAPEWLETGAPPDIEELWSSTDRGLAAKGPGVFSSGLSVLRGGYSGMLMLGMLAQVAGIAVVGPVSLGAGTLLGAKQFSDERKRQRERRQQEARTVVRQFLDQAQHELGARTQRAIQDAQRGMRDHYADRIRELSARYDHATQVLEQVVAADVEKRARLTTASRDRLTDLERLAAVAESGGPP